MARPFLATGGPGRAQTHGRLIGIPEPQLDWTV
jgi:hypothetical protein